MHDNERVTFPLSLSIQSHLALPKADLDYNYYCLLYYLVVYILVDSEIILSDLNSGFFMCFLSMILVLCVALYTYFVFYIELITLLLCETVALFALSLVRTIEELV
jgi:hypothetical protein